MFSQDLYITRFIRKDHRPTEDYYYHAAADALAHLSLFREDDSNLYTRIEVLDPSFAVLDYISFEE